MKRMMSAALAASVFGVGAAHADDVVEYKYDEHGRVIEVKRTGSAQSGNTVTTTYEYDKADNRTKEKTTGSPN